MALLNDVLEFFQGIFGSVFSSSAEHKNKQQLKQMQASLKAINPPIYRPEGILLPAFPIAVYQIYQLLMPISEILGKTIANPDRRMADRYRDFILELAMTKEQREMRKSFHFSERSAAVVSETVKPETVIENQAKKLTQFLKTLDTTSMKQAERIIDKLDVLNDFCRFDFYGFFSCFDPGFKTAAQAGYLDKTSFRTIEVSTVIPYLMDVYYLLDNLDLSTSIVNVVSLLEAKSQNVQLSEEITGKIGNTFRALYSQIQNKFSKNIVLSIIRLAKKDASFIPAQPRIKPDYIQQYKTRLTELFHSDSKKLLKEKEANEMQTLIASVFNGQPLEQLEYYNESTNSLLQELTPFSLEWVRPMEIIKTFTIHYFLPHFGQILEAVIIEGFFNNRAVQAACSSAYYYCAAVMDKIAEFEELFQDGKSCSYRIMMGYLSELKKGQDFEAPLRNMVDTMNYNAKTFIQQAVTQFAEVYEYSQIILDDNKKSMPEMITNIRTITKSAKNNDSFLLLEKEIDIYQNFLQIMKKYAIIGTISVSTNMSEKAEK
ncbi:DUF5312 family protein [Brucepastera parasyntrophica]|uniref:DUF5312 family protein n=1 Tax=Brucepastera parasyntrophica TaxID=2880008 RepID=UPI00210B8159|nr:DUF5312 family protein [Brucepastera parasyntrophica]ULQ58699.1 DUF5312 family protein [Brucepastera parasyntrophica]